LSLRWKLSMQDGIAHLVISAPPRNALDLAAFDELGAMVREALPRLDTAGLVVRGEGRHFSSGADIPELSEAFRGEKERGSAFVREHAVALTAIEELPYPTVAALSGSCLGAAMELALACRFRVAARRAVLSLPEAGFGLMPGLGGVARLAALVGRGRTIELVLSGRTIDAEEALSIGLVDAVVARADLSSAAVAMVRSAARLDAGGVSA
jgi:enoyl-CoA hydratase/carnithine racemase